MSDGITVVALGDVIAITTTVGDKVARVRVTWAMTFKRVSP